MMKYGATSNEVYKKFLIIGFEHHRMDKNSMEKHSLNGHDNSQWCEKETQMLLTI